MTDRDDSTLSDPALSDEPAHAPGALGYAGVWLALIVLATVTLVLSRAVTGGWGLVIAFAIAAVKAGLVVAFFMHLAGGRPIHRIVFAIAIAFLVLLVLGILADVATRSVASAYVDELGRP
ncbi:MAG TPA: cytochrome C oxidase subunit IV family protein [Kofleriaceae bacterium]|nr:cytochrome C oxidase subunit IV family protein [Kofleriaceae bacterium]